MRATKMTEKLKADIDRLLDERRRKMDRLLEPRWRVTGQALSDKVKPMTPVTSPLQRSK
jgi:hypothetical protein